MIKKIPLERTWDRKRRKIYEKNSVELSRMVIGNYSNDIGHDVSMASIRWANNLYCRATYSNDYSKKNL